LGNFGDCSWSGGWLLGGLTDSTLIKEDERNGQKLVGKQEFYRGLLAPVDKESDIIRAGVLKKLRGFLGAALCKRAGDS
jgi:hypothetical protein